MKADRIIKNAKIFTSDRKNPAADVLVIKDGKFIYVSDEAGLSEHEGFSHNGPVEVYFGGKRVN